MHKLVGKISYYSISLITIPANIVPFKLLFLNRMCRYPSKRYKYKIINQIILLLNSLNHILRLTWSYILESNCKITNKIILINIMIFDSEQ